MNKDNNVKTLLKQNRPMVKEQSIGQSFDGNKYNKIFSEIERPMNDTEYIEYLEKEKQHLTNQLIDNKNHIVLNYELLVKENQELKEQVNNNAEIAIKAMERVNQLEKPIQLGKLATISIKKNNEETLYTKAYVDKQQDKFIKVVEEILLNTWFEKMISNLITEKVALRRQDVNYLMNEIRKAMEND